MMAALVKMSIIEADINANDDNLPLISLKDDLIRHREQMQSDSIISL